MSEKSSKSAKPVVTPECLKRDGYKLHEVLGEGAYSVVYRATNTQNPDMNYACKRYKINPSTIKWVERCLQREMTLVMKVRHRSIVEAFTAIRAGDEAFLVIQYAPNGSVRSYLRKKLAPNVFLKENKIRAWASDIFGAVSYLHGAAIAHRDLKCDNYILDANMRPLVCDFSFACISDKPDTRFVCMVDTVCGTTSYLAPEVHSLKSGQKYDAKLSDVYALGISLYEMFVKTVPYVGKWKLGDDDLVKRQLAKDYTYPKKIQMSAECRNLIDQLLEPSASNRITVNRALCHSWFEKAKPVSKSSKSSSSTSSESFRQQTTDLAKSSSKKEDKSRKSIKTNKSNRSNKTQKSSKGSTKAKSGNDKKDDKQDEDTEDDAD